MSVTLWNVRPSMFVPLLRSTSPLILLRCGGKIPSSSCGCPPRRAKGANPPHSIQRVGGSRSDGRNRGFATHGRYNNSNNETLSLSIPMSLELLGLGTDFSPLELRDAYFAAAKRCHPDSSTFSHNNNGARYHDGDMVDRFLAITEAYETLQEYRRRHCPSPAASNDETGNSDWYDTAEASCNIITPTEEEAYRKACLQWLGQPPEIVEECKKCPLFREWLRGRSDSAMHWNLFFMTNGGLAPKLRPLMVEDGNHDDDKGQTSFAKTKQETTPRRRGGGR